MFTGIVEEKGTVTASEAVPPGRHLAITCRDVLPDAHPGASVAVSGVCLTVAGREDGLIRFDLAPETVSRSTLGSLRTGDRVNLERPVTLATRLGGHLVQGHVDGVGTVEAVDRAEQGVLMRVSIPEALAQYLVEKGSIAVDGVSLTVASVQDRSFTVALIPHTLEATTLGERRAGDEVNLEADVVAKYVERLAGRSA